MHAVARERCLNHLTREAVARCPECTQFYCRECITEHDDRVICAACLKKLAQAPEKRVRRILPWWPLAQGASGLLLAWMVFYIAGRLLLALPEEFHEEDLWKLSWFSSIEPIDE